MQHHISSLDAMLAFGKQFGSRLRGGEVLELIGDIGAGKTSFVKGLAQGLNIDDVVQSPTFTISRRYHARNGLILYHYDFYRLPEPGIMREELAEVLTDTTGIVALEWNETVQDLLPPPRTIHIVIRATSETERTIDLTLPPQLAYLTEAQP